MAYLLHHLLEESAACAPEAIALRDRGQDVSYRELDETSNRLANALRRAGVRRGDRVGIYLPKSAAAIAALFGILKAGGVYVPLDAGAPAARLAYIAANCDIAVLITSARMLASSPALLDGTPIGTVVLSDGERPETIPEAVRTVSWTEVGEQPATAPAPSGAIENDLAYILYTSGSTGAPKGVMIAHRTIFTFINWCLATFAVDRSDRVTSHAPLHFDLSTFDVFVTIAAGGTVVLVPEGLSLFPGKLVELLERERVTITYLVPSVLSMMASFGTLDAHDLSALRAVLFAGEVFPIKYLRQLVAAVPHPRYVNLYGPTETNVCTYYEVQPADLAAERTQPLPIGKACDNIEVFAIDENGERITAPGREGELWVRGSCVAQGYWGDPEKTARGFVPNRYQPHFGELAYRTGDVVTLADDGVNWLFLGRRDHMIKSRGYRIELGEIEAALYAHPDTREAVVVAIPDDRIGNRLRAFVVPHDGANGRFIEELLAFCGERLPRYMVPEGVELCRELPKTSSGKIDRTLLAGQGGVATETA